MAPSEGSIEVRVRYPEVDRMGFAHHANHFVWFEIGRTDLMRSRGIDYRSVEDDGLFLPVIGASCAYRSPARYDDLLRIITSVASLGAARVTFAYRIERAVDGTLLATGTTEHAAVDGRGRPRRLPSRLRELLS